MGDKTGGCPSRTSMRMVKFRIAFVSVLLLAALLWGLAWLFEHPEIFDSCEPVPCPPDVLAEPTTTPPAPGESAAITAIAYRCCA
ncbi:hypothetical protein [Nocardia sp. IFM 10818]